MLRYGHDVQQRWQLWRNLCKAADLLQQATRQWRDVDPELNHHIWMTETAGEAYDRDDSARNDRPPK